MRNIKDLNLEECQEILSEILSAVYGDVQDYSRGDHACVNTLNPDAEWTSDTIQDVAAILCQKDLVPDETIILDEHERIADYVIKEWDTQELGILPDDDDAAIKIFEKYYAERNVPLPWKTRS